MGKILHCCESISFSPPLLRLGEIGLKKPIHPPKVHVNADWRAVWRTLQTGRKLVVVSSPSPKVYSSAACDYSGFGPGPASAKPTDCEVPDARPVGRADHHFPSALVVRVGSVHVAHACGDLASPPAEPTAWLSLAQHADRCLQCGKCKPKCPQKIPSRSGSPKWTRSLAWPPA